MRVTLLVLGGCVPRLEEGVYARTATSTSGCEEEWPDITLLYHPRHPDHYSTVARTNDT